MLYLCSVMMKRSLDTLTLDGGVQPFHLVNTVYAWRGENLHEYLNSYADVLAWCAKVELLKKEPLRLLKKMAEANPIAAGKAFRKIMQTRKLLYRFFSALAAADETTLAALLPQYNKGVHEALAYFEWAPLKKELQFVLQKEPSLLLPLWLVLKAAHDVLLTGNQTRIKECPRCGWIFLDNTKNNGRRWCSPQSCGSVEKSKKYYRKKIAAQS